MMGERKSKKPGKLKKVFRQGMSTVVKLATMGQSQSHDLNGENESNNSPLRFHRTNGDNIRLESDAFRARRVESFCKGILFTDRPVAVREKVCLKIINLSSRWSGVIRVGFSAHDPNMLGQLPKYACPDLTSKPGYWAKAIPERYSEANALIHFFVAGNGDVHVGINGQDRGVFFSGVDTRLPLWGMIDLYGNCTGIELVDTRKNLNNRSNEANLRGSFRHIPSQVRMPNAGPSNQLQYPPVSEINAHLTNLNFRNQDPPPPLPQYVPPPPAPAPTTAPGPSPDFIPLNANANMAFRPMQFHFCTGRNLNLSSNNTIAIRHDEEFAQGYVFSAVPIKFGERIVIQVLSTEDSYIGSLAFGFTNCDPSTVDTHQLPEDSDLLLDRPEYWVVSKDVANRPAVGDELSFTVRSDGAVEFSKNNGIPSVFMHIDTSLRLWAFWDIYGNTSKIRILGTTMSPMLPPENTLAPVASQPLVDVSPNQDHPALDPQNLQIAGECIVCLENSIDCVIYSCGHMCMCHSCALRQWKGRGGGFCPVCRETIRDVIKTFRT